MVASQMQLFNICSELPQVLDDMNDKMTESDRLGYK